MSNPNVPETAMDGKKTYLTAAAGVLGALLGWYTKTMTPVEAVQLAFTAVTAAMIRHGVTTENAKPPTDGVAPKE